MTFQKHIIAREKLSIPTAYCRTFSFNFPIRPEKRRFDLLIAQTAPLIKAERSNRCHAENLVLDSAL